jgi:beta-glucosidase-like glycosyl hydrolase
MNGKRSPKVSRLGIPLVITSNPLNNWVAAMRCSSRAVAPGLFSVWPGQLGLAATNNPQTH